MNSVDPSARFWNRIAQRYESQPIKNISAYEEKLSITREYCHPTTQALEIGCGTGKTAVKLAPHVARIKATDFSSAMTALGVQHAKEQNATNVEFETRDAMTAGSNESYDLILAHSLIHLLEDPDAFLAHVRKLLIPGGVFVSNTVCLSDIAWFLKPVAPLGRWLGFLPMLSFFTHDEHIERLERAGFTIEYVWQPARGTSFIVAKIDPDQESSRHNAPVKPGLPF